MATEKEPTYFEVCWRGDGGLCGPAGGISTRGGLTVDQARAAAERMGRDLFGDRAVVREGTDPSGWGFGGGAQREGWRTFETVRVGGREAELSFGENPHSRSDGTIYARLGGKKGYVVGFSGHRPLITIEVSEENYLKTSGLSGDQVRGSCTAVAKANGFPILRVSGRKWEYVTTRVLADLQARLEHPIQPWRESDRAGMQGRRIYYRDTPAVIARVDWEQVEVTVEPAPGVEFPAPAYQREDAAKGETDHERGVDRVSVYDPDIWWWREALVEGERVDGAPKERR